MLINTYKKGATIMHFVKLFIIGDIKPIYVNVDHISYFYEKNENYVFVLNGANEIKVSKETGEKLIDYISHKPIQPMYCL